MDEIEIIETSGTEKELNHPAEGWGDLSTEPNFSQTSSESATEVEVEPNTQTLNEVEPKQTRLSSVHILDGIGQLVIEGTEPQPTSTELVVAEHMLDSMAPAYSEEDEILAGGWKKRVVVITGASEGIGYATATRFSLYADIVYNLGLYKQEDDTINFIRTDVTKPAEIASAFEKIYAKEGQIDVVINNAGVGFSGVAESATPETISHLFNINFMGTVNTCACAIPYMREQGRGRIINISSMAAKFPLPFQSYYSASKAAIANYSLAMRNEVKPLGIKVTCVMFSEVATQFTEHKLRNKHDNKAYKYRMAKSTAKYEFTEQQGREPEWVARKLFALSNAKNPGPQVIFGTMDKWRSSLKRFLTIKFIMKMIDRKY